MGGGGLSVGKESCMRISEKLTFGCALLELDTGVIQMMKSLHLQLVAVQSIYVAHKMATTGTYPSIYINAVKEGGLSLPSSCEGGGL